MVRPYVRLPYINLDFILKTNARKIQRVPFLNNYLTTQSWSIRYRSLVDLLRYKSKLNELLS